MKDEGLHKVFLDGYRTIVVNTHAHTQQQTKHTASVDGQQAPMLTMHIVL